MSMKLNDCTFVSSLFYVEYCFIVNHLTTQFGSISIIAKFISSSHWNYKTYEYMTSQIWFYEGTLFLKHLNSSGCARMTLPVPDVIFKTHLNVKPKNNKKQTNKQTKQNILCVLKNSNRDKEGIWSKSVIMIKEFKIINIKIKRWRKDPQLLRSRTLTGKI